MAAHSSKALILLNHFGRQRFYETFSTFTRFMLAPIFSEAKKATGMVVMTVTQLPPFWQSLKCKCRLSCARVVLVGVRLAMHPPLSRPFLFKMFWLGRHLLVPKLSNRQPYSEQFWMATMHAMRHGPRGTCVWMRCYCVSS